MRTGHGPTRRLLALAGSIMLLAGAAAVPTTAGAEPGAAPTGGFTFSQRAEVVPERTSLARAQRLALAHPRAAHLAPAPLARPDRFAGGRPSAQPIGGRQPRILGPVGLRSTRELAGTTSAQVGGLEPPDPFVGANGAWIVQSTNGMLRFFDRAGIEKASVASWAMFNVPPGYQDTDPRIVWDAVHGRWVGILIWFDYPTFVDNNLTVIVSTSSDPTGTWDAWTLPYFGYLPDYPAVASSTDKLVVTANEFLEGEAYAGSSLLVMAWSDLLSGAFVSPVYGFSPAAWNFRPGRIVGSSADVHLVYESDDTGTLTYFRLTGSVASLTEFEADLGIPNGTNVVLDPRQPGDADGISRADDGRIADAVWWNNQLWFTRTVAHPWNTVDDDMAVEILRVDTSHSGPPSVGMDALVNGSSGVDNFTSGVGASTNGTVFVTFSQSSAAQAPALRALAYHQSLGWQAPIDIAASDATYAGDRWGDFAGIAADPLGGDAVWQTHEVANADGDWRTVISRLVLDVSAPTVSAPLQALVAGTTLGLEITDVGPTVPTVPVKVSWAGSDPGSGITTYRVDRADHGSGFVTVIPGTTATSSIQAHAWVPVGTGGNNSYTYGAIAVDDGLNASGFAQGAAVTPTVYQHNNSVAYSGSWRTARGPSFSAGSVKYSSTAGSSATFKASGRSFAFVTTKASSRGKVKVYVDGSLKTTLKLASASTRYRNLGYVVSFASSGSHTIKLVVVTGRVDVDAFVVLR